MLPRVAIPSDINCLMAARGSWTNPDVEAAIHYVSHEQGEPMAVFLDRSAVVKIENVLKDRQTNKASLMCLSRVT